MKHFLTIILVLTCLWAKSQGQPETRLVDGYKTVLTPELGIPFGTIAKLEAEIFDGASLHRQPYENDYLLKIESVNGKMLNKPILLTFKDETKTLANNDFALYELLYKKKIGTLTGTQVNQMNKKYVGKKVTLMAYETGGFEGAPHDYYKYRPMIPEVFGFDNYLVIVSNLKK